MGDLTLEKRIRNVIKEHARIAVDVEALEGSADLYRAGMTSHSSVALMLALENEFDVEFPDNLLSRNVFESIDSIASAIGIVQQGTR